MISPRLFSLILVLIAPCAIFADDVPPTARSLSEYRNTNGNPPDGTDTARDDTSALQLALAAGPGVVYIGPGYYRFGAVTIPTGVSLIGSGPKTIVRSSGASQIFLQKDVSQWRLRDLTLDGEATGKWQERKDEGKSGLHAERCAQFELTRVLFQNFNGAALQLSHFVPGLDAQCVGNLDRVSALENYIGIRFDERAEYMNATNLICSRNVIGCVIHAGNVKIGASNFCGNTDGMLIEDKINGSHGSIANCLFNHNDRHALVCRKVESGMAITGCCFFYGTLLVEDSAGVNISEGMLSCHVVTKSELANRISGNYIISESHASFKFAPSTIVNGNFTKAGPWEADKP